MVDTIDVGTCEDGADVMGLDVTNTVIWLGEMLLDDAGICMTDWTLVTGFGLGVGLTAEVAELTVEPPPLTDEAKVF